MTLVLAARGCIHIYANPDFAGVQKFQVPPFLNFVDLLGLTAFPQKLTELRTDACFAALTHSSRGGLDGADRFALHWNASDGLVDWLVGAFG